ncbi:unnamed protein product [Penicillium camemberti]|uniref:Str. FM013 n=1 Tax=Penicillium camemberti (strain FM 013) TaxID=1429867 RepID=A0A0G4NTY6_PENC3|nr:unnamed protein product [Penicillium camemberti]
MAASGVYSRQHPLTPLLGARGSVGVFPACEFLPIGLGLNSSCPAPQRSLFSSAVQCLS